MKNSIYLPLILISVILFSNSAFGQKSKENIINYKKHIKFDKGINIQDARQKFISEFELDELNTFVEIQSNTHELGGEHQKYQQYYNGIKVEYGTMIIHSKNGYVTSINGEIYNAKDLTLTSKLMASNALASAKSHIGAQRYLWEDAEASKSMQYKKPEGEMVIFPVLENGSYTLELAYKFDIYATAPVSRGHVYVNSKNGNILFNNPIIKHFKNEYGVNFEGKHKDLVEKMTSSTIVSGSAETRYSGTRTIETREEIDGTFTLNDDVRNVHTYDAQNSPTNGTYENTTVDFTDNDNIWTTLEYDNLEYDNAALDAHWGAMNVIDFWSILGRNSFDDNGAEIRNYVHVGTNYVNAFWNGSVMSYGDAGVFGFDPLTSIGIVAHEIAHAVTTSTANLVYARESGALNEGFSDIFGAATNFFAKGTGSDLIPNTEIWIKGGEVFPVAYQQSMSDPNSTGDPDTYNGLNYIDASNNCIPVYSGPDSNDGCGVHTNSFVLNHWFYILVAGKAGMNDAGDIYDVSGIGMTKAQEIAYLTLRDYLTPNSTFMDARDGAIEVASSLYGSNSSERAATQDAFYAVNLGEEFVPFATDINLIEIVDLVDMTCGESITPKIKVRNSGASNIINEIVINYTIDEVSQTPVNWNGNLAMDAELEIYLPVINELALKSFDLEVEVVVVSDGDATNNNLTDSFRVNKSDDTPTEVNSFNFFYQNWLSYSEGGDENLWEIGTPNKTNLNSVTSGDAAYVTRTTLLYPNETKSYLISPCYDLTSFSSPKMKFNMAFELQENYDILYIEYSTDSKNWIVLGSATDSNWYNSDRIYESPEISEDCQNCPGAQWTGSNSVLEEYSYDLSAFVSESNINFRFVFHSDASGNDEGVVIDDFVIEDSALGSDKNERLDDFVFIHPNPSSNNFNFVWNKRYDRISIEILDVTGKLILKKDNVIGNDFSYSLNMSNYSKGLYYARICLDDIKVVEKIILQ